MKTVLKLIGIFFLAFFLITGCAGARKTESQLLNEWTSNFPRGFDIQLEVALAASKAYHKITDTSIRELRTPEGAQQVGILVTAARDKYRHWQSYGQYYVPRRPYSINGVVYGSGLTYSPGDPGQKGSALEFVFNFGNDGRRQAIQGVIKSTRGRVIFGGRHGDERNWILSSPFDNILQGDRIADIPNLIAIIKR